MLKYVKKLAEVEDVGEIDSGADNSSSNEESQLVARGLKSFRLADLEIGDTLTKGAFSRIRVCRHILEQKVFSLKVTKKLDVIRLEQLEHVSSELNILKHIDHPFLGKLVSFFQDEARIFHVFEFTGGGDMFSRLRAAQSNKFTDGEARFYASEVALGLCYLHNLDIAHRNVKPETIEIDSDGHVVIMGLEFAKIVKDRTTTVCGTPEYCAPEILQGVGYGMGVDWWAFGVLVFEMLAGFPPFYDRTPFGVYQKILDCKLSFPRGISFKAQDLIRRLLVVDRTRRLGCEAAGASAVKRSKWFSKVSWDALYHRQIKAPFVPSLRSDGDTSHFDSYPDSVDDEPLELTGQEAAAFEVL